MRKKKVKGDRCHCCCSFHAPIFNDDDDYGGMCLYVLVTERRKKYSHTKNI